MTCLSGGRGGGGHGVVLSSPRGLPVTCSSITSIALELEKDGSIHHHFHLSAFARSPRRSKEACQLFSPQFTEVTYLLG